MEQRQPTARQRQKWLRRAKTILAKAEALNAEMLTALGVTHIWTDYGDNIVAEAETLVDVLDRNTDRRHA